MSERAINLNISEKQTGTCDIVSPIQEKSGLGLLGSSPVFLTEGNILAFRDIRNGRKQTLGLGFSCKPKFS